MESSGNEMAQTSLSQYFGKAEVHFAALILIDDLDREISNRHSPLRFEAHLGAVQPPTRRTFSFSGFSIA